MKTLTLLRHAKSGWDDPALRDFDRPLNDKGRRAAQTIGRHLRAEAIAFDRVVASPARRVVETLAEVEAGYGGVLTPEWDKRLYLASPATQLDIVQALPDAIAGVLLVGHNPGLEELVLALVPQRDGGSLRERVERKFPTATLATMTFAVDAWEQVATGGATLVRFVRPRDLDATLGPDEE